MKSTTPAYAVPFWIDRDLSPRILRIVNMSDEVASGLRATLLGSGHLVPLEAAALSPGRSVRLTFIGVDSADSIAVLRWFRPDGDEFLWRFAF